jgi:hypothetical protein
MTNGGQKSLSTGVTLMVIGGHVLIVNLNVSSPDDQLDKRDGHLILEYVLHGTTESPTQDMYKSERTRTHVQIYVSVSILGHHCLSPISDVA